MNLQDVNDLLLCRGLEAQTHAAGYVTVTMRSIGADFLFTVPSALAARGAEAIAQAIVAEVARVLVDEVAALLRPTAAPADKAGRPGHLGRPD